MKLSASILLLLIRSAHARLMALKIQNVVEQLEGKYGLSYEHHKQVEQFASKPEILRHSIVNPAYGDLFLITGGIYNFRLYLPDIKAVYNNGERDFTQDECSEPITKLMISLFLSDTEEVKPAIEILGNNENRYPELLANLFVGVLKDSFQDIKSTSGIEAYENLITALDENLITALDENLITTLETKEAYNLFSSPKDIKLMAIHNLVLNTLENEDQLKEYLERIYNSISSEDVQPCKTSFDVIKTLQKQQIAIIFGFFNTKRATDGSSENPANTLDDGSSENPANTLDIRVEAIMDNDPFPVKLFKKSVAMTLGQGNSCELPDTFDQLYFSGSIKTAVQKIEGLFKACKAMVKYGKFSENDSSKDNLKIESLENFSRLILRSGDVSNLEIQKMFDYFLFLDENITENPQKIFLMWMKSYNLKDPNICLFWEDLIIKSDLQSIDLFLSGVELNVISRVFNTLAKCKDLKKLRISRLKRESNFLNGDCLKFYEIAEYIMKLKHLNNLKGLDICGYKITQSLVNFIVENFKHLEHLGLSESVNSSYYSGDLKLLSGHTVKMLTKHGSYDGNSFIFEIYEISKLVNLTSLDLQGDNLESLPTDFCSLTKLTHLNLSWNKMSLDGIRWVCNTFKNLESLDLSSNNLKQLPGDIGNATKLRKLNLNDNKLERMYGSFCNLVSLEKLDLSENCLQSLPKDFYKLVSLKRLDVRNNKLLVLPGCIRNMPNLVEILIEGNDNFKAESNNGDMGLVELEKKLKKLNLVE